MITNEIYRDFTLNKTSVTAAGKFLQAVVLCEAQIICIFSQSNGFNEDKITYFSSFYKLKFRNQDDLDCFHRLGFTTSEPEVAQVN